MTAPVGRYPARSAFRSHLGPTEVAAATATQAPIEDQLLLEQLELDWSVPCEYRTHEFSEERCGAPASWWVICRECGHALAECEPHRMQQAEDLGSPVAALFITVVCSRCDASIDAPRWRDLFIVEPIGRLP